MTLFPAPDPNRAAERESHADSRAERVAADPRAQHSMANVHLASQKDDAGTR